MNPLSSAIFRILFNCYVTSHFQKLNYKYFANIKWCSNNKDRIKSTKGYNSFLKDPSDESTVSIIRPEFTESKNDEELVGSGGYEIFSIKAISKGEAEIIIDYKRPWKEKVQPEKTFEIAVSVE